MWSENRNLDTFMEAHWVDDESYLNILRAGITSTKSVCQINGLIFLIHGLVATILNSNKDIQFILDEYSYASYVMGHINKSNCGK